MANWTSGDNAWRYDEGCDGHTPTTIRWQYQTTADILTLEYQAEEGFCWGGKIEAHKWETLLGHEAAVATYEALRHWMSVYCGEKVLARADQRVKERT